MVVMEEKEKEEKFALPSNDTRIPPSERGGFLHTCMALAHTLTQSSLSKGKKDWNFILLYFYDFPRALSRLVKLRRITRHYTFRNIFDAVTQCRKKPYA